MACSGPSTRCPSIFAKARLWVSLANRARGSPVLLRSIMGLMHQATAPREGSVRFDGRELVGLRRRELRRLWGTAISIVFQDPMSSLNPVLRVGRQIGESVRSSEDGERVDVGQRSLELLRLVGIPEPKRRLRQYPHELSGGMRQRVAIASARWLAVLRCCSPTSPRAGWRPQVLLADHGRRNGSSPDPRPPRRTPGSLEHGDDPGVARLGRGGDQDRQDHRDVCRAGRGARADPSAVPVDADALHRGADPVDPEARRLPATPDSTPSGDVRPTPRPDPPGVRSRRAAGTHNHVV